MHFRRIQSHALDGPSDLPRMFKAHSMCVPRGRKPSTTILGLALQLLGLDVADLRRAPRWLTHRGLIVPHLRAMDSSQPKLIELTFGDTLGRDILIPSPGGPRV